MDARRGTALTLTALAAAALAPAGAQAASVRTDYTCSVPGLTDPQPMTVALAAELPTSIDLGARVTSDLLVQLTLPSLADLGIVSAEGQANLATRQFFGDPIPPTGFAVATRSARPADGGALEGTGSVTVTGARLGADALRAGVLDLALTGRDETGAVVADGLAISCRPLSASRATLATFDVVPRPPMLRSYALAGGMRIDALQRGNTKIGGRVELSVDQDTGAGTGAMTLQPARMTLRGWFGLPIALDYGMTVRDVTATSTPTSLDIAGAATLSVTRASIFGFTIDAGLACSAGPAALTLSSVPGAFDPVTGGRLAGRLGALTFDGCGLAGSLLPSASAAGAQIAVAATPVSQVVGD